MDHVYLICTCVFSIELFLRLNLLSYVNSVGKYTKKTFNIFIASKTSDHWKEKIVPAYASIILKNSLSIIGLLFLGISIFLFFVVLSDSFLKLLLSAAGIVESVVASLIYFKLRTSLNE